MVRGGTFCGGGVVTGDDRATDCGGGGGVALGGGVVLGGGVARDGDERDRWRFGASGGRLPPTGEGVERTGGVALEGSKMGGEGVASPVTSPSGS